jgi:hypothetical protein
MFRSTTFLGCLAAAACLAGCGEEDGGMMGMTDMAVLPDLAREPASPT